MASALPTDARLLFVSRAVRLFAYGALSVVLVLYLRALDLSEAQVGIFLSTVLVGDTAISLALSAHADHIGRRVMLISGAILMLFSGVVFAIVPVHVELWLLTIVGIIGVISPSGNEVGPFLPLEMSILAQFTTLEQRPRIFGWYNLTASASTAFGSLAAGFVVTYMLTHDGDHDGGNDIEHRRLHAYRVVMGGYGALAAVLLVVFAFLSRSVESSFVHSQSAESAEDVAPLIQSSSDTPSPTSNDEAAESPTHEAEYTDRSSLDVPDDENASLLSEDSTAVGNYAALGALQTSRDDKPSRRSWSLLGDLQLSPESRPTVTRLCLLFMLDAFGASLVTGTFLAYYFKRKYDVGESYLGSLLFFSNIIVAASALVSAWICGKLGLVKTMVLTHVPANILIILVPFMPSLATATTVIFIRASISQMDTVPRAAYVASAVPPNERTAVIGLTNIVRTLGASVGPLVTGWLAHTNRFDWAFVLSGSVCIVYDMLILVSLSGVGAA